MTHVGQVVTRETCIDRIWQGVDLLDTRTLDTHVKRIRTKIEPDPHIRVISSPFAVSAIGSTQNLRPTN